MSRRRQDSETGFGSDSFLDIIANIVGILIILIVIAGVRVSQAPVITAEAEPEPAAPVVGETEPAPFTEEIPVPAPSTLPSVLADELSNVVPEKDPFGFTSSHYYTTPLPAPPTPEAPELSTQLVVETRKLEAEVDQLRNEQTHTQTKLLQMTEEQQKLRTKAEQGRKYIQAQLLKLEADRKKTEELAENLQKTRERSRLLESELELIKNTPAPTKTLQHRVTPVSQVVNGPELHFQIKENKVAFVPIEELLELLKRDIERNKRRLVSTPRVHGEIGPIGGYAMSYVLERQTLSTIERLNQSGHTIRIALRKWELKPTPGPRWESVAEATQRRSDFSRVIQSTQQNATVTFWVSPDSFGTFRELQTYAHRHGLRVAGRPLPAGVPISGSPSGSRSAGQ